MRNKLSHEDTYEMRALFLVTWHGGQTKEQFPEWHRTLWAFDSDSVDRVLWLRDFCMKALEMRAADNA